MGKPTDPGETGVSVSFRILVPGRVPGEAQVIPAQDVRTEAGGLWFTQEGELNSHFLPWHRIIEIERTVTGEPTPSRLSP